MCICVAPRSCPECEGWTKEERTSMPISVSIARKTLADFKKIVNRSSGFGDAEVYFYDGDVKVNEGYLGSSRDRGENDKSSIIVNGVEFTGEDARAVLA